MVESLSIENTNLGKVCNFDMEDADYLIYEGAIDWGEMDVSHTTFQYSKQIGKTITETVIGSRDVSINGWIIGTEEEIKKKKKELSTLINPLDEVVVHVDKYKITGKPSSNVKFSNTYKENNNKMCKFLIQLYCSYPLFLSEKTYGAKLSLGSGMFHFPWILYDTGIVLSIKRESAFTEIFNGGSMEIGFTVILEASTTVNNPAIIDINTLQKMKINKVLQPGEYIEIKTNRGNRSVMGRIGSGEMENYLDYFDFDNDWMQLPIGTSMFTMKSYDEEGREDTTYRGLDVTIKYNLCFSNMEGE